MSAPLLREASSVIVLRRDGAGGYEVFLLRRRRGASFMASAFVFPGGGAEAGEDARTCAARELFEEAGVLLAEPTTTAETRARLRAEVLGGADATAALSSAGLHWSTSSLLPWAHWVTPSIEPKRFNARFFVTELPAGQEPTFDAIETVDQEWVRPADAIARAKDLMLPPPQLRTFHELAAFRDVEAVLDAARARTDQLRPILPRLRVTTSGEGVTLMLPWDPEYVTAGSGDAAPMSDRPAWASGPSRFVLEDRAWKHLAAPGSTITGS